MTLTWARPLLPALMLLALAAPVHGQSFRFPWWKDAQFTKDLSLTADQSARIDRVFNRRLPSFGKRKRSSTCRRRSCRS